MNMLALSLNSAMWNWQ